MNRTSLAGIAAFAAALLLLGGCASTTLTNAWTDPEYKGGAFRKVLVVGATDSPTTRRVFEDEFARELRLAGVQAVASHTVIAQGAKVDEAMLRETVRKQGLDGVFVTRLVRIDTQTTYSPGYGWGVPAVGYRQSLYGYYNVARAPYVGAPEVGVYELAVLETTLWSAASSKLVWSATTETFAPENVRAAADDFSKVVIGELKARKLL